VGQHCNGDIRASVLREHIAGRMGYNDANVNEGRVSGYVQAGLWKLVTCNEVRMAMDFKGYVIEELRPLLNVQRPRWDDDMRAQYAGQLQGLTNQGGLRCNDIGPEHETCGVHVFYHDQLPEQWRGRR